MVGWAPAEAFVQEEQEPEANGVFLKQDLLEPGGWEAFATEGRSDGWNLPRSDLEERRCITTLHLKYEGCLEVDVFLWVLWGSCSREELLLVRLSLFLGGTAGAGSLC